MITIDPTIAGMINDSMGGNKTAIELPFETMYVFWTNGESRNQRYATVSPVDYYGGWVFNGNDLTLLCDTIGQQIPANLYAGSFTPKGKETFDAYQARNIVVAPFGMRSGWFEADSGKMKSKIQVLCYMAEKAEGQLKPWGVIVLTAASYQAQALHQALADWKKKLTPAINKYAPGVPAWFFYCSLGTFGDKRQEKLVGKTEQSPIVPIRAYIPEVLDEDLLQRLFVGDEIAAVIADYNQQAQEWLHAWDQPEKNGHGHGNGNGGPVADAPESFPEGYDENIPF